MKIRLTANSVAATKALSELDLSCGYSYTYGNSYDDELNPENSWSARVFEKLEKSFSSLKKIPEEDQNFVKAASKSAKFLNEHFDGTTHIANMHIAMNVNSPINNFIKNNLGLIYSISPDKAAKLIRGTDTHAGYIHSFDKKMVLGTSLFINNYPEEPNTWIQNFTQKYGLENAVDLIVFHEASHAFELTNKRMHGSHLDPINSDLFPITTRLSDESSYGEAVKLNQVIKEKYNDSLGEIDPKFMKEINILYGEIYADAGSILLMRNKDFTENNYDKQKTLGYLDSLIEGRHQEHHQDIMNCSPKLHVSRFNHFTAPGLEHLKSQFDSIPERVLSDVEIHKYAQDAVKVGMARVLVTSLMANNENVGQLKTLFHLNNDGQNFVLPESIDNSVYLKKMTELKSLAGDDWIAQFKKNIAIIRELGITDRTIATWHAGVNQDLFQKELTAHHERKKKFDELLGIMDEIDEARSSLHSQVKTEMSSMPEINDSPISSFVVKDKEAVIKSLSSFRNNPSEANNKPILKH